MNITEPQRYKLRWLHEHGGRASLRGGKACVGNEKCPGEPIGWLHLVAKGLVEGDSGDLFLTGLGRVHLQMIGVDTASKPMQQSPTESGKLP